MENLHRKPATLAKAVLLSAALPALAEAATIPFPRRLNPPVLLSMPTANVLGHWQYQLSGRFQYFTTSMIGDTASGDTSATEAKNMTYNSELLLGIENRAELGFQYGSEFSLSLKALLVREDILWPDVVFGVRNILGTPEGGLYGVEDSKVLKTLYGESYGTVAKNFPSASRLHLGFSYLNGANKSALGINLGLEQDLGGGAYLGYEVFERFSDFHQVLVFNWRYKGFLGLTIGLTEFQSWIRQEGEWGFFLAPSGAQRDGYNSPGITFSLQVQGFAPRREKRTLPERVAILEVRNVELEKRLVEASEALARAEARLSCACGGDPDGAAATALPPGPEARQKTAALLQQAAEKLAQEIADPEEIRQIMHTLAGMGPGAAEALQSAALDPSAGELRIPAVLTMAYSRDSAYAPTLRALFADKDARIRREALTALTKVHPQAALEDARRLLSDPDETVALAAGEAYRMLGGEPLPEEAAKVRPEPVPAPKAPARSKAPSRGKSRASGHSPSRSGGH